MANPLESTVLVATTYLFILVTHSSILCNSRLARRMGVFLTSCAMTEMVMLSFTSSGFITRGLLCCASWHDTWERRRLLDNLLDWLYHDDTTTFRNHWHLFQFNHRLSFTIFAILTKMIVHKLDCVTGSCDINVQATPTRLLQLTILIKLIVEELISILCNSCIYDTHHSD